MPNAFSSVGMVERHQTGTWEARVEKTQPLENQGLRSRAGVTQSFDCSLEHTIHLLATSTKLSCTLIRLATHG
jgi:hypothetical protein